ncbi:MAG: hypothetical protein ACN4GR_02295 [Arenicellales bacterium]
MPEDNVPAEFFVKFPQSAIKSRQHRIWEQINILWCTRNGVDYINTLLVVEKGRERQGFDADVISELMVLAQLQEKACPEVAGTK